jgi:hypothetical protein
MDDVADAIDRFLGGTPRSLHTAALRDVAHATLRAWREGRVPAARALHALGECLEAVRTLERGRAALN